MAGMKTATQCASQPFVTSRILIPWTCTEFHLVLRVFRIQDDFALGPACVGSSVTGGTTVLWIVS